MNFVPTTYKIDLDPAKANFPLPISLGNQPYYLVRSESGYQLISRVCPHQGREVSDDGECFTCPLHGWRFEHGNGKGINNRGALSAIPVTISGDHLLAEVPCAPSRSPLPQRGKHIEDLAITLHVHSCLEVAYKGFSLLTDPWLCGSAFLGSWIHYPAPIVNISTLRPDAIWISHEHSDHFHKQTLDHFDRSTPIYVPDFPNRRLTEGLTALGFQDIRPMAFGERVQLSKHIHLTCFEPGSLWNDAIVMMEIDGFRLLNINDAGINHRIASLLPPVDMVASLFVPGASGYPWTWSHLSQKQKVNISKRSAQGLLEMLKQMMKLYGAKYLLPFAGNFTWCHPTHREYVRLMSTNTLDDVVQLFEGSDVQVIPLLPGESWESSTGKIKPVWHNREELDDINYKLRYIEQHFDQALFSQYHACSTTVTRSELEGYFLQLNDVPDIVFCEEITVTLQATQEDFDQVTLSLSFSITAGRLEILSEPPDVPNLLMKIPLGILAKIVKENLSWDEAHIGHWCRFSRSPNIYNAGFWRLLQAPYYHKPASVPPIDHQPITGNTVIADLLETHGNQAQRILGRYGLYCLGCHHSTQDTITLGAKQHGLNQNTVDRLVRELNQTFHSKKEESTI
ncbi:MAG: Rieske 2Fe-2S domain-containing protein [Moorea sp. SIO2I5]|nr:Rieske 2Fe-2S domain-containing protein [Moorena sp. SIO2I5]